MVYRLKNSPMVYKACDTRGESANCFVVGRDPYAKPMKSPKIETTLINTCQTNLIANK